MMTLRHAVLASIFTITAAAMPLGAAEVSGVKIAESVTAPGGQALVLNGAGLRSRAIFKVYTIGLYVEKKSTNPMDIIAAPGAKRIAIQMLRTVSAADFSKALSDGVRDNHSEADAKPLESRMRELTAIMDEIKEAKDGMQIVLDFAPGSGTVVRIDNQARGKPITGDDFFRALLRIWLGNEPASKDLKQALLGAAG
jgi:hypothetical protein